ncbi:MAG: sterol desaturase/sphingolipid hydroxylase (fatty acid hydroxylase superfamily) [Rhodothermales bacterium]|jgi:sterol desaturase/sphingolipid hydroxylase (fatty acid hydroxylase superfamily)
MDFLAASRTHPVDSLFQQCGVFVPVYWLGFSAEAYGLFLSIWLGHSYLSHANVSLPWRWLERLIVTPDYHHRHHALDHAQCNSNFAAQLPLFDWLFGSRWCEQETPVTDFGCGSMRGKNYLQHLLLPFMAVLGMAKRRISSIVYPRSDLHPAEQPLARHHREQTQDRQGR